MRKQAAFLTFALSLFFLPLRAFAHEVYVLGKDVIAKDVAGQSPNPFSVLAANWQDVSFLVFSGLSLAGVAVLIILIRRIEFAGEEFFLRIKKYAPLLARVTVGLCFLACAYYRSLFGPELPFSDFGTWAPLLVDIFYALGICFLFGIFARLAAVIGLVIFSIAAFHYGIYIFTYLNYLGEMLVVLLLGAGSYSVDGWLRGRARKPRRAEARFEPLAFLILRISFGVAIIYASYYAKFLYSQLALDTVTTYHLANYFHFEPLLIVLGAFLIESLIGIFFILGIELRFTALFFLSFLFLSLFYFGEVIWPHLVLIGLNLALILYGYDQYTLGGRMKRRNRLRAL